MHKPVSISLDQMFVRVNWYMYVPISALDIFSNSFPKIIGKRQYSINTGTSHRNA